MEHDATTSFLYWLAGVLLLLGGIGSTTGAAHGQGLSAEERSRLAPRLRAVVSPDGEGLDPLTSAVASSSGAERYGVFVRTRDVAALRETALPVRVVTPGLATARVTPDELRALAQVEGVRALSPVRTYSPANDGVRAHTGAHLIQDGALGSEYTGKGVLACVIDTGIDWTHRDFRGSSDSTRSRIRALWDQTLDARADEAPPSPFEYGVEYTREDIEGAIRGNANQPVRSRDASGHGTHVTGTIAGNGAASSGTYRGMAPEAEIVAVKTDFSGVGIADGISYCGQVADEAKKPVVVNLSLGTLSGPHDGTSPLAQVIQARSGTGTSIVAATGNHGDTERHVEQALSAGTTDSLRVQVPRYTAGEGARNDVAFRLDTWIDGSSRTSVAVITPGGQRVSLPADSAGAVPTSEGTVVYENAESPGGSQHVEVVVHDAEADTPPASGTWAVAMTPQASSATVHGWLVNTTTGSRLPEGDRQATITTPGTADRALSVGSSRPPDHWPEEEEVQGADDEGAMLSGRGPLRTGQKKPDLSAPGEGVISPHARTAEGPSRPVQGGRYARGGGTSTSAATVSGAVALLLQQTPTLRTRQVATLLKNTARTFGDGESSWDPRRGHGMLDLFRAVAEQEGLPVATREQLAYDEPATGEARTTYPLGDGGADAVAVRMTPSQSGIASALYLRTASGSAPQLRDSITVEIRADEDGRPGRSLGTAVRVPPEALVEGKTNVVSLREAGVLLEKGTDYHVVVEAEGGEVEILAERRSVDGRSSVLREGTWSALNTADLALRVGTVMALDLGTPRLREPEASAILDAAESVPLSWTDVPEATSYAVQLSPSREFPPERTDTLRTQTSSRSFSEGAPGTSYYWRVRAERLEYEGAWSEPRSFLTYPSRFQVRASRSFETTTGGRDYRLVALPGDRPIPLAETVDGKGGEAWQAFWDRGEGPEALASVEGSVPGRFRPGTGFWLRSKRPWTVQTTVPTVPLETDGTYAIELHEGWNIISNPFGLDVAWDAVRAANDGPLPSLWRYTGQFERTDTFASARTGDAFYLLNDEGRDALRVPYPAVPEGPSGGATKSDRPPALTLIAYRDENPAGQVQVGLGENAKDGRDPHDEVAPPARFARTTFRVEAEGDDRPARQRELAVDYRPAEADGHTFTLTLETAAEGPVEIRAEGLDAVGEKEVVLLDSRAGDSHNLRATPTVTVRPDEGTRSFRLLVGSSDYVEAKKTVALPSEVQFLPNYPNPFRDQTTLEYVLPEPMPVRLAVFDVLGRQVRVLVDEEQEAGRHTVQWDGHDESGKRLASGVYLARLVVGGETKVRKMTFVR